MKNDLLETINYFSNLLKIENMEEVLQIFNHRLKAGYKFYTDGFSMFSSVEIYPVMPLTIKRDGNDVYIKCKGWFEPKWINILNIYTGKSNSVISNIEEEVIL